MLIGHGRRLKRSRASHPSTSSTGKYDTADLPRLARRPQSEAENELHLLLAWVYRRGHHKLLIYPFRPPPAPHPGTGQGRPSRSRPTEPTPTEPTPTEPTPTVG